MKTTVRSHNDCDSPFPVKGPDGRQNPDYSRYWALTSRKGMTQEQALAHMKAEKEAGHSIKVASEGKLGDQKKKPSTQKPAPVKRNGDGAVAVSGEDLLRDPRVPDSVKDQIRAEAVSHQPHTDGLQRSNTFHQPQPSPASETTTYTPPVLAPVNLAPTEKCLSNIAVCLSEICDKLDTMNLNLANRRW